MSYTLADQGVRLLGDRLRLRQATRLAEDGHQNHILTSRRDIPAIEVAFRMFERWMQENLFKYLREEYALDALVDYGVIAADPERDVPNAKRAERTVKLEAARPDFDRLTAEYGVEAFINPEHSRPTMRGFKIAQSNLVDRIRKAFDRISTRETVRSALPKLVSVGSVVADDAVKPAPERKLLTSIITMVAYQAESDLVHLIAPHYKRATDEGRALIQSALAATGDIHATTGELRVTLAPLSSPHRSRAIAALCADLSRCGTTFPGSHLRLHCSVELGDPPQKRTFS